MSDDEKLQLNVDKVLEDADKAIEVADKALAENVNIETPKIIVPEITIPETPHELPPEIPQITMDVSSYEEATVPINFNKPPATFDDKFNIHSDDAQKALNETEIKTAAIADSIANNTADNITDNINSTDTNTAEKIPQILEKETPKAKPDINNGKNYINPDVLSKKLKYKSQSAAKRTIPAIIICVISFYMCFAGTLSLPVFVNSQSFAYSLTLLLGGIITIFLTYDVLLGGIKKLFTLKADFESVAFVNMLLCTIACFTTTSKPALLKEIYDNTPFELYMPFACLGATICLILRKNLLKNAALDVLKLKEANCGIAVVNEKETAENLSAGTTFDTPPIVAVERKTENFTDIEKKLLSNDLASNYYVPSVWLFLVISIAFPIILIFRQFPGIDFGTGKFLILNNISVFFMFTSNILLPIVVMPLFMKTKKLFKTCVITNFKDLENFSDVNQIFVTADDILILKDCSVKSSDFIGINNIEKAFYTVYMLTKLCEKTENTCMLQYLGNVRKNIRKKHKGGTAGGTPAADFSIPKGEITNFENSGNGGCSANFSNQKLLFGCYEYMHSHNVKKLPPKEKISVKDNESLVFFAVNGVCCALFNVTLKPITRMRNSILKLQKGLDYPVFIRVATNDPVINSELLSKLFKTPKTFFSIFNPNDTTYLECTEPRKFSTLRLTTNGNKINVIKLLLNAVFLSRVSRSVGFIQLGLSLVALIAIVTFALFHTPINPVIVLISQLIQIFIIILTVNLQKK